MDPAVNRRVFGRIRTNNTPRKTVRPSLFPVDRFVSARRSNADYHAIRSSMFSNQKTLGDDDEDLFKQDPNSWRTKNYSNVLGKTLSCEKNDKPILKFTQNKASTPKKPESSGVKGWACAPRKRPIIGQPDIIFDLPGYQDNMHNDILDWGKNDMLLAALGNQLYMWHSPSNEVGNLYNFHHDTVAVAKWDPEGVMIAIGTYLGNLFMFDSVVMKMTEIESKHHQTVEDGVGSITSLSWDPRGSFLACCASTGTLSVCNSITMSSCGVRQKAHEGEIINCSFSPDGKFLVTCGVDCMVRIWNLPSLTPFFQIIFANPSRALAWHPWRGCQMALGGGHGAGRGIGDGSLSIWDVGRQTNLCHKLATSACSVDALAWSSLTAELLISYWVDDVWLGNEVNEDSRSRLLVLAAPDRVTDQFCVPPGRIRALLFSPDGTKIASASSDENLLIWNFLGTSGPLLEMYKRKMKRGQMNIHEINEYNNFGYTIR